MQDTDEKMTLLYNRDIMKCSRIEYEIGENFNNFEENKNCNGYINESCMNTLTK